LKRRGDVLADKIGIIYDENFSHGKLRWVVLDIGEIVVCSWSGLTINSLIRPLDKGGTGDFLRITSDLKRRSTVKSPVPPLSRG
jgi:hypothetical protein